MLFVTKKEEIYMTDNQLILSKLTNPKKLWSRQEILQRPSPIPAENGIYAWYFKEIPNLKLFREYFNIDSSCLIEDTIKFEDYQLLYIGISPSNPQSKNNIRNRIRSHMNSNASASTLRLTLGCLLREELNIQLKQIRNRYYFGEEENILSSWIERNAFVTFEPCHEPWIIEEEAIKQLNLPLNILDNEHNNFYNALKNIRKQAKNLARKNPYS